MDQPSERDTFSERVIEALNAMRRLIDAASDVLHEEVKGGEYWEDHPANEYREIGLKIEERLWRNLHSMGIEAEFDRSDGTWKLKTSSEDAGR